MIKNRNVALYIVLSIVTCGIFALYWFVCIADDANTLSNNKGTSGRRSLVADACDMRHLRHILGIQAR